MGMDRFTSWLKMSYDKLLAVIVLSVLIVSLLYLAVKIGMVKAQEQQWRNDIVNLVSANPKAEGISAEEFRLTMARLENPHTIDYGEWTRRFIVPEERYSCEDCKYPNPMDAEVCASCEKKLDSGVIPADFDEDGDGIPNLDEIRYGLDPLDPDDAALDLDGDGFSNLLEHQSGSDPRDPKSIPPVEVWIKVDSIVAEAFNLLFKAYSTDPAGERVFQLNTRDKGKTHFAKLGEVVENFTLTGFETNFVQVTTTVGKTTVDESRLTLKTVEREMVLTKGQAVKWDKFNATLIYERNNKKMLVRKDEVFEVEGNKYIVNSIDTKAGAVVITRTSDNKVFELNKHGADSSVKPAEAGVADGINDKAQE